MQVYIQFSLSIFPFSSQVTGLSTPSNAPWPWMWETGGGIVVPCNYIVFSDPDEQLFIYQALQTAMIYAPGCHVTMEP